MYYYWITSIVVLTCVAIYREDKLKSKLKRLHIDFVQANASRIADQKKWKEINDRRNLRLNALETANIRFSLSVQRLTSLVRKLRKRQVNFDRSITWFKTEETDIRVLKVQAREQLAIDLENGRAIEYLISENVRPDIGQTEITVKARIKTLNMK